MNVLTWRRVLTATLFCCLSFSFLSVCFSSRAMADDADQSGQQPSANKAAEHRDAHLVVNDEELAAERRRQAELEDRLQDLAGQLESARELADKQDALLEKIRQALEQQASGD